MAQEVKHIPDDFCHRTCNWETVSGFGRSGVATATMAAPFIGYAILYHSTVERYLGGARWLAQLTNGCRELRSLADDVAKAQPDILGLGAPRGGFNSI